MSLRFLSVCVPSVLIIRNLDSLIDNPKSSGWPTLLAGIVQCAGLPCPTSNLSILWPMDPPPIPFLPEVKSLLSSPSRTHDQGLFWLAWVRLYAIPGPVPSPQQPTPNNWFAALPQDLKRLPWSSFNIMMTLFPRNFRSSHSRHGVRLTSMAVISMKPNFGRADFYSHMLSPIYILNKQ